jgi:predicted transposase YdaD
MAEIDWAYDDGLEKGLEKGREETARNALAKGLPMELIHEITGLDMETLENLATLPRE